MMKVTVLVDNDTLVGINFQGEPALSFYVEADGKKILFDTGFSDLFLKNAFLGQIPRVLEFENTHSKVVTKLDGDWEEDKLLDDTSLVFDGEEGLVILSGCAHAGICNTVEAQGHHRKKQHPGYCGRLPSAPSHRRANGQNGELSLPAGSFPYHPLPLHRFSLPLPHPSGGAGASHRQRQRAGIPLIAEKTVLPCQCV